MFLKICSLLAIGCFAQVPPQPPADETTFARTLLDVRSQLEALRSSLKNIGSQAGAPLTLDSAEQISDQLDRWLGMFHALELQPTMDMSQMSQLMALRLRLEIYDGVILGESHGIDPEISAGVQFVKDIETFGYPIGALLREKETFPNADFLKSLKIPVLTIPQGMQFQPDSAVQTSLQKAGHKILVTYTGHAHTAIRLKDYFLYTLREGTAFGYAPGKKDMPTVEDSFLKARKHPIIVAMITENRIWRRIQQLFLYHAMDGGALTQEKLSAKLRAFRKAWDKKISNYPTHPEPIYFVRSPEQENLFIGLVPGQRLPVDIDAALRVLSAPESAAWLQGDPIQLVESLWSQNPMGCFYRVIVHKSNGGEWDRWVKVETSGLVGPTLYTTEDMETMFQTSLIEHFGLIPGFGEPPATPARKP